MRRLAALAAFKLSFFLKPRVNDSFFKTYSRLLDPDVTEKMLRECPEEPEELFFDEPELGARYRKLYDRCGGDPIALTAIQLCILAGMEERTVTLLREGLGVQEGLTVETAGKLACPGVETIEMMPRLKEAFEKVNVLLQADCRREWLKAPFLPDWRLSDWIGGGDLPEAGLGAEVDDGTVPLPPAILTQAKIEQTAEMLRRWKDASFLQISGESGSGRQFFVRHVARLLGQELLMVPFASLEKEGMLDETAWRKVLRELMLTGRMLCICDLSCPKEQRSRRLPLLLRQLERDLTPMGRPVFLTSEPDIKVTPFLNTPVHAVAIPRPTILESRALWQSMAQELLDAPEEFPSASLASKMTLTPGQIRRIMQLVHLQSPQGPWKEQEIFKRCYQVLDDGRYENIRFVDTAYTWEDLQLEEGLKRSLLDVCHQVEHQGLVLDEWGLRRRYPYGRCVSVLMSGPPGTGKTMTAQVLSSRLGLELYKVDLSQIVDKYIGETEKRLSQVFDQAEKSNMVLFFDEADALLGKRSEVKDAKDKYANTEVAYLLQRMEEYQGIVLMATNQAGSMDAAFLRRFRYHLVFSLPDEAMRRRLWADALAEIPSAGIQMEYLARQFQLSGAQIKNIALNGAYRAAADGGILHMDHLVQAIFQEFQKEGKVMLSSEFGEYGVMLSDYLSRGQK